MAEFCGQIVTDMIDKATCPHRNPQALHLAHIFTHVLFEVANCRIGCSAHVYSRLRLLHAFVILLVLVSFVFLCGIYSRNSSRSNVFIFSKLSKEKIAMVERTHVERGVRSSLGFNIDDLESIRSNNMDPLPPRLYEELSAEQMCQSGSIRCIAPFIKMGALVVTSPKHRIATCLVQKNMSTLMMNIICYLLREREFLLMGRQILKEKWKTTFCEHKNLFNNVDSMLHYLKEKNISEWSLTMVTREPTDRFLSGFIDRCLRLRRRCYGCGSNMTCFLEQTYFRAGMYAMSVLNTENDQTRQATTAVDRHIFPQNWRCNLEKYYKEYEFIRYSSDPTEKVLRDLIRILRAQKVSRSSIDYISNSLRFGRTAHSTVTSKARELLEHRLRSSPYLMELLVRTFYYDFKLFGYPLPDLNALQSRNDHSRDVIAQ